MKKLFVLIILGIMLAGSALQCSADPVNLETCFRAALKQSDVMADNRELVNQAEEHFKQALAGMLPNVSAGYTYFNQDTSKLIPDGTDSSLYRDQATTKASITHAAFPGASAISRR